MDFNPKWIHNQFQTHICINMNIYIYIYRGEEEDSLLNALLQILYQVIACSRPLVVRIGARSYHEVGSFPLVHLGMEPLAEIPDRVSPAEAR